MPTYTVEVTVALSRPPRADATYVFVLEAENGQSAELLACHWANGHKHVVMPVGSIVTDWSD